MPRIRYLLGTTVCLVIGWSTVQTTSAQIPVVDVPKLTFTVERSTLVLSGAVSSVAHESILRQRALTLFPDKQRTFNLVQYPVLPAGWALVSELTLFAVAESYSSRAEITGSEIKIDGIRSSQSAWQNRLEQLQQNLLPGMQLSQKMVQVGSMVALQQQCVTLFRNALKDQKIDFPRSGYTLSSSTFPLLDRLIQIGTDCPSAHISITGHTDSTGEEAGNVLLSQARAESIAAYFSMRGIKPARISARGVGSVQPITSGETAQDHKRNRRIEIDLEFSAQAENP